MAKIILQPKEKFEHQHSTNSITVLLQGELIYECDNKKIKLVLGEKVDTPANRTHTLENIGDQEAIVDCIHRELSIGIHDE